MAAREGTPWGAVRRIGKHLTPGVVVRKHRFIRTNRRIVEDFAVDGTFRRNKKCF